MNCDGIAKFYWWLEYAGFGVALERRRKEFLPEMLEARCALVLGDGDGRFLAALLHANSRLTADCVDLSAKMLALARSRAGASAGRVNFHQADARQFDFDGGYDLIVTHFFLDCFDEAELSGLAGRIAASATDRAQWIISEFRQPARGFSALRAAVWLRVLYALFRWTTGLRVRRLPKYHAILAANGFRLERSVMAQAGLLVSELWQKENAPPLDSRQPQGQPRSEQNHVRQHPQDIDR